MSLFKVQPMIDLKSIIKLHETFFHFFYPKKYIYKKIQKTDRCNTSGFVAQNLKCFSHYSLTSEEIRFF